MGTFLLILPYLSDYWGERSEEKRRVQKVELRRQYVGGNTDSPSAFEGLGDAMREAGMLEEAIAAYQIAKELIEKGGKNQGGGYFPGAGLDSKLRITQVELAQERSPELYESTMRTRPPICSKCGHLGMPFDRDCQTCGAPLPVDSFFDTWKHKGIRNSIIRDTGQMVAGLCIVWAAMLIVDSLPDLMRLSVSVAAVFVIPLRLLKRVGPD